MSKILGLYSALNKSKQRFIDEVFGSEIYRSCLPQLTIIDAGAYKGEFSFYALNVAKIIYAFEPDPRPYRILEQRVKNFKLGNIIKTFPMALSGKTGKRIFHASGYGGSRLLDRDDLEYPKEERIKVKTISLVDFMDKFKIEQIDIFKIDVEQGENEIFNTPEFPELSKNIKCIIGEHLKGVNGLLKSLGYKAKGVGGENTLYVKA